VSENREPRGRFVPKREDLEKDRIELRDEKPGNLYSSLNIVRSLNQGRRIGWDMERMGI
jgi:hypothetical protein